MAKMNANSPVKGRVIEFKQVGYGYRRINPLHGAEYVLDLLLVYKRFRGKKLTVPVRRHAYLQQTFSRTEMREVQEIDVEALKAAVNGRGALSLLSHTKNRVMSVLGLTDGGGKDQADDHFKPQLLHAGRTDPRNVPSAVGAPTVPAVVSTASDKVVHMIVPLVGRVETLTLFMSNLERISLALGDAVSVMIVLFRNDDEDAAGASEAEKTKTLMASYRERYPSHDLRVVEQHGKFSRGLALAVGASHFSNDSLLFVADSKC